MTPMELKQWTESERGRATALAAHLRVPVSFVSKMVSGEKPVPIAHMAAIEAFTQGAVSRKEMRPDDWMSIWPELAEAKPQTETAQQPATPPAPPPETAAEDEDAAPAQPMDLAGQCDNNRRATSEADAGSGPCLQPPDIDGESEEARPPRPHGLAVDPANGQPVPPPGFSGEDENGSPAAPPCEGEDSQPLLVLDDEAGKAV